MPGRAAAIAGMNQLAAAYTNSKLRVHLDFKGRSEEVEVLPSSSFGHLKELASRAFGIPQEYFRLLFRGREKPDSDILIAAGLKSGARVMVMETAAYREAQPDPLAAQAAASYNVPSSWTQFGAEDPAAQQAQAQMPGMHQMPGMSGMPQQAQGSYSQTSMPQPQPQPQQAFQPHQQQYQQQPPPAYLQPGQQQPSYGSAQAPMPPAGSTAQQPLPPQDPQLQAIASISGNVDGLEAQAQPFLASQPGQAVDQFRLRTTIEQLTQQLLKLDGVEVQGNADIRAARKAQIARIEGLADRLERLKQA